MFKEIANFTWASSLIYMKQNGWVGIITNLLLYLPRNLFAVPNSRDQWKKDISHLYTYTHIFKNKSM